MLFDFYTFLAIDHSYEINEVKEKIKNLTIKILVENITNDELFNRLRKLKEADLIFSSTKNLALYTKVAAISELHTNIASKIKTTREPSVKNKAIEFELFFNLIEIRAEKYTNNLLLRIGEERLKANNKSTGSSRIANFKKNFLLKTFHVFF